MTRYLALPSLGKARVSACVAKVGADDHVGSKEADGISCAKMVGQSDDASLDVLGRASRDVFVTARKTGAPQSRQSRWSRKILEQVGLRSAVGYTLVGLVMQVRALDG